MDLKLSPRGSMRILYDPVRFEDFEAYSGPTFLQLPPLKHSKGFSVVSLKCWSWLGHFFGTGLLDTEVGLGLWDMWKQYKAKTEANQDVDTSFAVTPTDALVILRWQAEHWASQTTSLESWCISQWSQWVWASLRFFKKQTQKEKTAEVHIIRLF